MPEPRLIHGAAALPIRDAAQWMGLSIDTVRRMIDAGRLPAIRARSGVGTGERVRLLVPAGALYDWLDSAE